MDGGRMKDTPIIVLTADANPESKTMFMEKGFNDYLLKPVDIGLLESALVRNLPGGLVIKVDKEKPIEIPQEVLFQIKKTLSEYDISLDMAMKHLCGDILQFIRIAEFFTQSADKNMDELKSLLDKKDYETAALIIHSVKGNSGNIGAEDLYYNARRLERRAKESDGRYVDAAAPLFFMEWERARNGLLVGLAEFDSIRSDAAATESKKEPLDKDAIIEELINAISNGNQAPALKYADMLAETIYGDDTVDKIRNCIRNIDFDRAMELVLKLKR
jgi:HPt (histidine-containing phosphotransfer) domain-containing protein